MDEVKPFDIPKREVWEAFKKVKANALPSYHLSCLQVMIAPGHGPGETDAI